MITWRMVLKVASNKGPEIHAKDIAEEYDFAIQEAQRRLELLRTWGYLRHANPEKRTKKGYHMTEAGTRLVDKWSYENTDLTRGTGFQRRCKECTHADWRKRSEQREELEDV